MQEYESEALERYEDALFALLMDGYVREEVDRLIAEAEPVCSDPDFALPEGMEARGLSMIQSYFRKQRRAAHAKTAKKILSRAAIVLLALNIAFWVPFFTVDAFYVKVMNMVLDVQQAYTRVTFESEDGEVSKAGEDEPMLDGISATEIFAILPETFVITDLEEEYLDYGMSYGRFEDGNGTYITWDMFPLQGTGTNIDTEDADYVEETTINGFDGMVVSEDGDLIIMWGDTVTQHIYTVCTNLSREDAMEIIEAATQ